MRYPLLTQDDEVEDDSDGDSDSSDEDDAQELMNELEKIKQERIALQALKEQEELEAQEEEMQERASTGNPLLAPSSSVDFGVKRRLANLILDGMMMLFSSIRVVGSRNQRSGLLMICFAPISIGIGSSDSGSLWTSMYADLKYTFELNRS
jgi:Cwf15/Cwc15 cell cycle control protein